MGILGTVVLILSALLSIARRSDPPAPLVMLQSTDAPIVEGTLERLAIVVPGQKTARPITDYADIRYLGVIDGWYYIWDFEDYFRLDEWIYPQGQVYRLRSDGTVHQTIADGNWMIYPQVEPVADSWHIDL